MSSQSYSTFQSSSYSSSTDSAGNTYTEATSSNPSGTTFHRSTKEAGRPEVAETTHISTRQGMDLHGLNNDTRRIEDVSDEQADADRKYQDAIDDEYAKREGGA